MTNREKINAMSNKELAELLTTNMVCNECVFMMNSMDCLNSDCSGVVTQWLESEVEE